jgi:hypothetical protein
MGSPRSGALWPQRRQYACARGLRLEDGGRRIGIMSRPERLGARQGRCGCRLRDRGKRAGHAPHCRFDLVVEAVPFRQPARGVVGEPGVARCVLLNECLER